VATAGGFEAAVGGLGVAGAASWGGFGRGGSTSFAGIGSGRVFSETAALLAGRDVSRRPSLAWLSNARIATVIAPAQLPIVTAVSALECLDRAFGFQHA
jgi:hypothetical protein